MAAAIPLRNLFVYPIERHIPPVAKVNDVAEATVETDLIEYVVTVPIERALLSFLEIYADSRKEPTDKIGVWISGFFGSGKSHFAKILSYLLENPTIGGQPARTLFAQRLAACRVKTPCELVEHAMSLSGCEFSDHMA